MSKQDFQLTIPLDAILFDCDGTLSSIEGVDELAALAGAEKASTVRALTEEAMGKTGMNPSLYQKRLSLICPTKKDVEALGENYFNHRTPEADIVIGLLQRLKKNIYIVSAGLFPAVSDFGKRLHIAPQNVFAVDVQFDQAGCYHNFDKESPLTRHDGKQLIVERLKKHHPRILYVGDGLNDLVVRDLVTRFVGYGGAYYRQNIADQCEFYIDTPSFLPLLPLILTESEYQMLSLEEKEWYEKGLRMR